MVNKHKRKGAEDTKEVEKALELRSEKLLETAKKNTESARVKKKSLKKILKLKTLMIKICSLYILFILLGATNKTNQHCVINV